MEIEVLHVVELIVRLIEQDKLKLTKGIPMTVIYHDPCHLGRLGETRNDRKMLIPVLTSHLERTMREKERGTINVEQIEQRITELKGAMMELILERVSSKRMSARHDR